jgi:DNA-binding NarL/FixJ family response regulator
VSKLILVVDDNAFIRHSLYQLFTSQGDFDVCGEAENGAEAIEKAQASHPDVIVTMAARKMTMETKATRSSGSGLHVQFPIPSQGSPLDFLLIEEQVQSGNHHFWSLPKLLRQISLTDDHVPGRVPLVNGLSIRRNSLSYRSQFFLLVPLSTFASYPVTFQSPQAYCGDPEN